MGCAPARASASGQGRCGNSASTSAAIALSRMLSAVRMVSYITSMARSGYMHHCAWITLKPTGFVLCPVQAAGPLIKGTGPLLAAFSNINCSFRLQVLALAAWAASLTCSKSGFGGSSLIQRSRPIPGGLLNLQIFIPAASFGACGSGASLPRSRSGLGGSSVKQRGAPFPCRLIGTIDKRCNYACFSQRLGHLGKRLASSYAWNSPSQFPSSLAEPRSSIADNARRLGERGGWGAPQHGLPQEDGGAAAIRLPLLPLFR